MDERIMKAIEEYGKAREKVGYIKGAAPLCGDQYADIDYGSDPANGLADAARTALEEAIEDYADAIHRSALSRGPGIP
jgi:hypothetical protein